MFIAWFEYSSPDLLVLYKLAPSQDHHSASLCESISLLNPKEMPFHCFEWVNRIQADRTRYESFQCSKFPSPTTAAGASSGGSGVHPDGGVGVINPTHTILLT